MTAPTSFVETSMDIKYNVMHGVGWRPEIRRESCTRNQDLLPISLVSQEVIEIWAINGVARNGS